MPVAFPAWYKGGWPDRELVVMDLLQPFLDLLTPQGEAVRYRSQGYDDDVEAGGLLVRVYRGGGAADPACLRDPASVQLAAITQSRQMSGDVIEYCRQIMLSYQSGGPVHMADDTFVEVDAVWEIMGPQEVPEDNPDERIVPLTFGVECRKPLIVPDYQRVIESLGIHQP